MFYVYTLTDPRDGKVFYVGKGSGERLCAHEKEAMRGKRGPKCDRIREIWASGHEVERKRVATFRTSIEALFEEGRLIEEIGLHNLTNIAPGGRGGRHKRKPVRWTEEMLEAIAPRLRRVWRLMDGGDGRVFACGVEVTDSIASLLETLRRDLGAELLAKHLGATNGAAI